MKTLVFVSLVIVSVSCDILSTRTPENPQTQANNNIPATTPDILFSNFKSSVEEKVLENYISCFVDKSYLQKEYHFIPSGGSSSKFPILANWNLDAERQYFKNQKAIANPGKSIILDLSNQVKTQLGDSAIYQFDYTLSLSASDQNISNDYTGSAQFKIALDSRNYWVIVEWSDFKKNNLVSWSELKGKLLF